MLRASREALLTVVEVVLHDPLCKWALTPVRAKRRQREDAAAEGLELEGGEGAGALGAARWGRAAGWLVAATAGLPGPSVRQCRAWRCRC